MASLAELGEIAKAEPFITPKYVGRQVGRRIAQERADSYNKDKVAYLIAEGRRLKGTPGSKKMGRAAALTIRNERTNLDDAKTGQMIRFGRSLKRGTADEFAG